MSRHGQGGRHPSQSAAGARSDDGSDDRRCAIVDSSFDRTLEDRHVDDPVTPSTRTSSAPVTEPKMSPDGDVPAPALDRAANDPAPTITSEGRRRREAVRLRRGSRVGHFEVRSELGRGGMGTVYEAYDERLDRTVALKVLHAETERRGRMRLRREAEGLAKLSHPNVVQVYDVDRIDDRLCIVMERIEGRTLEHWQSPRRPWRECLDAYVQAGRGLAEAHAKGLVHRDFKPSNCIIDDAGRVRVLDFGLVCEPDSQHADPIHASRESLDLPELSPGESLTRTGATVGTPAYMSLEQFQGQPASSVADQFSFCVSLYEALYGQHPLEWSNRYELALRLEQGEVRPPPPDTDVPRRVWKVLERGLQREPTDRWPSMDPLLESLEAARRRRSRGWAWGLGVTGLLGVGLWSIVAPPAPTVPSAATCAGSETMLAEVWDDDTRTRVLQLIEGTHAPHAHETARRVRERLDDYAERWARAYDDACAIDPPESPESTVPRQQALQCLTGQRSRLRATSRMLATADVELVHEATRVVSELPAVEQCADPMYLQALVPVPEDPKLVVEVDAVRQQLADVEALESAGRYDDALERAQPLMRAAESLGFEPLLAEVQFLTGHTMIGAGRYPDAVETLTAAYFGAERWDIGIIQARAAVDLVMVLGYHQAEYEQARRWRQHASADVQRLGDERLHTVLVLHEGRIFTQEGKYDDALATLGRARQMNRALASPGDTLGADIHYEQGIALEIQGKYAEAAAEYREALSQTRQAVGPEHPRLAKSYTGIGNVLLTQGRFEDALVEYRKAQSLWDANLDANHPEQAHGHNNVGIALSQLDRYSEAHAEFRAALAIRIEALGPEHPSVAESHDNLGIALRLLKRYDEALAEHRKALAIDTARLEPGHVNLAYSHNNIATVLQELGQYEQARVEYRTALEIWSETLGPRHPQVAYILLGLAKVELACERASEALEHAERALAIRQEHEQDPHDLALTRFAVARALWATHRDPKRARALAGRAREAVTDPEHPDPDLVAEIDRALAEHR